MNWEESADWEKSVEFFEQVKRIADQLERIADSLASKKSRKVVSTEITLSDSEQKLLDGLDVIEG